MNGFATNADQVPSGPSPEGEVAIFLRTDLPAARGPQVPRSCGPVPGCQGPRIRDGYRVAAPLSEA